jgi:hypothetical protein
MLNEMPVITTRRTSSPRMLRSRLQTAGVSLIRSPALWRKSNIKV